MKLLEPGSPRSREDEPSAEWARTTVDGSTEHRTPAGGAALPVVGQRVAQRFRIARVLGTGGMGTVFEAVDEGPGQRPVALKILHRASPEALRRIKREFREVADLHHPSLVVLHELFADEHGFCFFTMGLVRGRSFREYVRAGGRCDEQRLSASLAQLAGALEYLHSTGRIHRDLKPSNVLVTDDDHRLVIVDFGLVLPYRDETRASDSFSGTPAYAAPEQRLNQRVGPASDWYAVGVMVHEALTGRVTPAFDELLALDTRLSRLCVRLLEPDPARRAGAPEVFAALGLGPPREPDASFDVFVGREREHAELERELELARAGGARVVLVSGESGIGKTALVRRFLDELARRGSHRILSSRCYAYESVPYQAVDGIVDSLASALRSAASRELEGFLPVERDTLAQLFPVLSNLAVRAQPPVQHLTLPRPDGAPTEPISEHSGDPTAGGAAECVSASFAAPLESERVLRRVAFEAFKRLLASSSGGAPLLLFVDDFQWADADSAELLAQLLAAPALPCLLLLTSNTPGPEAVRVRERLLFSGNSELSFRELALAPFSRADVDALVERLAGADGSGMDGALIYRQSFGHPMFALELAKFALERNAPSGHEPASLERALAARIAKLSAPARGVLEIVCLAGVRLPRAVLLALDGRADVATFRELHAARMARELVSDGQFQVEPYHERVRRVVLAELPGGRRRAIYQALTRADHAELGVPLELIVDALVVEGRRAEAAALAETGARRALAALAFNRAIGLFERALLNAGSSEQERSLRLALAEACLSGGRAEPAARQFERAAEQAHVELAILLRRRAMTLYFLSGHAADGRRLLGAIGAGLGLTFRGARGGALALGLRYALLALAGQPALRTEGEASPSALELTRLRFAWSLVLPLLASHPQIAARYTLRCLYDAARLGEPLIHAQAASVCASAYTACIGRSLPRVQDVMRGALTVAEQRGDYWDVAFIRAVRGGQALYSFELRAALNECVAIATSRAAQTELGSAVQAFARIVVTPALYWMGRLKHMAALCDEWLLDARAAGNRDLEVHYTVFRAHEHLCRDDAAAALRELEAARAVPLDERHMALRDPHWEASVLLYEGRPTQALELCRRMRRVFLGHHGWYAVARAGWYRLMAMCQIALVEQGASRSAARRRLARYAASARLETTAMGRNVADELDAVRAFWRGDVAAARARLECSAEGYQTLGMRLHAAATHWALAHMAGPNQATHDTVARAIFAEEQIRAPEKWVRMLLPGLPR